MDRSSGGHVHEQPLSAGRQSRHRGDWLLPDRRCRRFDRRVRVPVSFAPLDPDFEPRVRASFGRQGLMTSLGARLVRVAAGEVDIEAPFDERWTQQHGYVHAGIVTALVDSACGYSALSLARPEAEVLTVEYKVNFLAPAQGERFLARGRVVRAGARVTVCSGEVYAVTGTAETQVAVMLATIITV
ncbi:MAG: PaaI family thioesterase [Chloroflexi bacterium]|nr:PaaI family thioesterase [Chloroflexota bacterium]